MLQRHNWQDCGSFVHRCLRPQGDLYCANPLLLTSCMTVSSPTARLSYHAALFQALQLVFLAWLLGFLLDCCCAYASLCP